MRRKHSKRRAARTASSRPRRGPWITRAGLWRFGIAMGWTATFSAVAYGLHRLEPYAHDLATQHPPTIQWQNLPVWLTDPAQTGFLDDMQATAGLRPDDDVFAPDLAHRIAQRLTASPWVAKVRGVRARSDGVVQVDADFRTPLTWIIQRGMAYLVDENGVRLPQTKRAQVVNRRDWLVIEGCAGSHPPIGSRWRGADVTAGLRLVTFLEDARATDGLPFRGLLRAVNVENFRGAIAPRAGRLRIATIQPKSYIHWGLEPGKEYDIEGSAPQKLDALRILFDSDGDVLSRYRWIDLRDPSDVRLAEKR